MPEWTWPGAVLSRMVDGDTFDAALSRDIGFHGTVQFQQRLRLARINAPSRSTPAGAEAMVVADAMMRNRPLLIVTTKPYKYGDEWMAEVTLPSGANVSDELVSGGHALPWDGRGPRPGG